MLRNPNALPKPELTQVQDHLPLFERKPQLSSQFLRSSLLEHLGNDTKIGGGGRSSMYSTIKFPSFLPPPALDASGMKSGVVPPMVPDFPFSLPFKFSQAPKISGLNGLVVDYTTSIGKNAGFVGSYMTSGRWGEQALMMEDMKFLTPKQELKDHHFYDAFVDPTAVPQPPPPPSASMFPQAIATYPS